MNRLRITTAALLAAAAIGYGSPPAPAATAGPALSVDPAAGRHAISRDIYGMNFADAALEKELNLPVDRWGGNATTRYNYLADTSNHASDWYFENIANSVANPAALPDGSTADQFVDKDRATGADTIMTVPLIGWVAKSRANACGFSVTKYGAQQSTDQWSPDCGNGVKPDGTDITGNDPTDTSMPASADFVSGWVKYLDGKYGDAAHGGVRFYNLDNEPDIWHSTHRDVHPQGASYDEMKSSTYAIASAVKATDPAAQTLGPVGWGWNSLFMSGLDQQTCSIQGGSCWSNPPDKAAHGGVDFGAWYLQQMAAYQQAHGTRILDYFDNHWYPQGANVSSDTDDAATQALRLRSTRSLWDPTYSDESWINQPVMAIPRMKNLVAQNYPGTKTAISEYNWGALKDADGGIAQADILGIFGREGLDLATLWSPPASTDPGAFAFRMYLNYDGNGSGFGDTSVSATSADQGQLSVYAAQRSSDKALTVMVINKTTGDLTSPLSIAGLPASTAAQVYQYAQSNLSAIAALPAQSISGGQTTMTFPAYSITELVIPAAATGPQPPSAPGQPTVTNVTATSAMVSWPAATAGDNPVASYHVYQGNAELATVAGPATSATLTGLTPATAYSLTVTAVDSTGLASPPSPAIAFTTTAAASTCHIVYTRSSEWPGGFVANVTVTNTGTQALNGWNVGFTYPGDQKVTGSWNTKLTQTGANVKATSLSYNASLAPGASTTFGMLGTWTANDSSPTSFTLNTALCN